MQLSIESSPSPSSRERTLTDGVLVLCAGRHAVEVIDALTARGTRVFGCLDGRVKRGTEVCSGATVVGSDDDLESMVADGFRQVYLGIGGLDNLDVRIRLFERLERLGVVQPALVHPAAHVAPSVTLGRGSTVLACASIGPLSVVGRNCVITQNAALTHHCIIGDHVVIAPHAVLAAGVRVDNEVTIGMGVSVYHDLHIGRRSVVVNGVDLLQDVPEDSMVKHRSPPPVICRR